MKTAATVPLRVEREFLVQVLEGGLARVADGQFHALGDQGGDQALYGDFQTALQGATCTPRPASKRAKPNRKTRAELIELAVALIKPGSGDHVSLEEVAKLPGAGPKTAQRILDQAEAQGLLVKESGVWFRAEGQG